MIMKHYSPRNWYWFVSGDKSRLWSSAMCSYVPSNDSEYRSWVSSGGRATNIASEYDLAVVLKTHGIIGPIAFVEDVNAERDRRVASGFSFNGHMFQSRVEDQKRINGAVTMAILAIQSGAQPGNLRWHGGDDDFGWIAADNSLVAMDAHTVVSFGLTAGDWESKHVFAARALKDNDPIPLDFADDRYWP